MFGIWRALLSVEVVAHHLLGMPVIGFYAVFSFFVLSGFLMTAIMHGTYGYTGAGFARYASNRALRLFPSYWFAMLVSLALIALFGGEIVARYNPAMTVPHSLRAWAENISMIFWNILPKDELPRLVPLTWALTVEISCYVLIGLGASRTRLTSLLWLIISLAYVVVIRRLHPEGGDWLYAAIPAGFLPFSIGALAWHYRGEARAVLIRLGIDDPRLLIVGRWLLYGAIMVAQAQTGWKWLTMFGNWLNICVSALIVCALFAVRPNEKLRGIDKIIGDFSYPIYLLHIQMGLVAGILLFGAPAAPGLGVFILGLFLTILLSLICARVIDPVVERLRTRIKPQ
jgi:peptidoglycan/LPS O-acetylase OafA/YrhL